MILPLLVALCLAAIDLARGCLVGIALGSAARAGAEFGATRRLDAATESSWMESITSEVHSELGSAGGVDPSRVEIEVDVAHEEGGLHVCRIQLEYPFETVIAWPMAPSPIVMRREVRFRRFR